MEQQDRYIRFDWALQYLLRRKANFGVLKGFLAVLLDEARQKLIYYNMPKEERHAYDEYLSIIMIQNDVLDGAKQEGRIEGRLEIARKSEINGDGHGNDSKSHRIVAGRNSRFVNIAIIFASLT